jgi:hypothetical protein
MGKNNTFQSLLYCILTLVWHARSAVTEINTKAVKNVQSSEKYPWETNNDKVTELTDLKTLK